MRVTLDPDRLATLEIDEGKANAIAPPLIAAFDRALDDVERQGARGLVVTGAGRHFCAGLDLASVSALSRPDLDRFLADFERVFERFFLFPMPVVARVNGSAVAGGCILAAAADYRVAAAGEYRVGTNEVRIGVTCPSVVIDVMRALLAPSVLHRVVLGAELFDPETARSLGLLDEIVPAERLPARAAEVARARMASPLPGYARQKRELRGRFIEPNRATYADSRRAFAELWSGAEATAARDAVLAKIRK